MRIKNKSQLIKNGNLLFIIIILMLILSACGSNEEFEPIVSTVEKIEFETHLGTNKRLLIETEKEVLIIPEFQIKFYTTTSDDTITLTQIREKRTSNLDTFLELFNDKKIRYELLIPEEKLKPISSEYANLYGETFEYTSQKNK